MHLGSVVAWAIVVYLTGGAVAFSLEWDRKWGRAILVSLLWPLVAPLAIWDAIDEARDRGF